MDSCTSLASTTTLDGTADPSVLSDGPSDEVCCARVRDGDLSAFAILYRRHHPAALRAAISIAGRDLAEEHTAEAFARVLALLKSGRGPDQFFRSYVCTAIRNAHISYQQRIKRTQLSEDPESILPVDLTDAPPDRLFASETVTTAFRDLPERWRIALWLQTVEGRSLTEVGDLIGLNAHGAAQLTFRAREALRMNYLAAHLQAPRDPRCEPIITQLPRHVRSNAGSRKPTIVAHLRNCGPCADGATDLQLVAAGLPGPSTYAQRRRG